MKKALSILLFVLFFDLGNAFAQIKKINLDLISGELNGGLPIPAEEQFAITGAVPDEIQMVKLTLYPSKKTDKVAATYFWKAPFGYTDQSFQINVDYPLRSNQEHELEFRFYQKAGKEQIEEVRNLVFQNLKTYLSTIVTIKKGGVDFSEKTPTIMARMDEIVTAGLFYFELPNGSPFSGFSDLTRAKLDQHKNLKLSDAEYNTTGLSENDNARAVFARNYLDGLYQIIEAELGQYLSPNMLVMVDEKLITNYRTEDEPNVIPLNAGFGAISLSQDLADQEFVSSPYVGVSFPLGNRAFSKFMNNFSLSAGVFISGDMENSLNERISGPLIDRPIYVGLGYNFFRIIRLNAGGTFTTTEKLNGSNQNGFNPFIGLSAEFNLWLGFGKKK